MSDAFAAAKRECGHRCRPRAPTRQSKEEQHEARHEHGSTAVPGVCGRQRALALAGSLTPQLAHAQSSQLTIGVLRAPASAVIDLADKRGWFKEAGVELKTELFASAAGPKLVQALGGGAIDFSFVNTTAALLGMAGGAIPLRFISI